MSPQELYELRLAQIHGLNGAGGRSMDIRHDEFMAMAEAFLGPDYDQTKLELVEQLQLQLHAQQVALLQALKTHQLQRRAFVDESNRLHSLIAAQCEAVLGKADFYKLFGSTAADLAGYIDADAFLLPV